VFVSSHLLSEVAQTVDDVVVLSGGRLVAETTLAGRQHDDLETFFFDLVHQNQELASRTAPSGSPAPKSGTNSPPARCRSASRSRSRWPSGA
jgi:ABC-type multidrug transport system ATPase subunit